MFHFLGGEMQSTDLLDQLSNISCPTLVIGGVDDPVTPASGMRAIVEAIGPERATLDLLDGASHIIWADRPDCVDRIREWLLR